MKLTAKQLRQIIKEELDDVVGGPMYGHMPSKHPMIKMSEDILSAAMSANYNKITTTARRHARAYAPEMMKLGPHSKTSIFYDALEQLGKALYNYEQTGGGLERLIMAAKDVKMTYTPDNQRPVTDDDPDF